MITPQQRNAWRGAYLRQLRKIAQTPFIPDLDLDEGEEFSWDLFDESDFEEHLGAFSLRVMVPLWSAYVHVIKNHPFAVATIDAKCVRPEDAITREGLFQYLQAISHYGQDTFFLNYPEIGDIEEELIKALDNNDETAFLYLLDKEGIDTSDMRIKVGYTNRAMQAYQQAYNAMESDNPDAIEEVAQQEESYYIERGADRSLLDSFSAPTEEETKKIIPLSQTNIGQLDEESQQMYAGLVKQWIYYLNIVNLCFMDKETSIIKELIEMPEYQDIVLDIEQLAYRVYDFTAERLYQIDSKQA